MATIFTRILQGEIPASFVYRDEVCACFMSINPIVPGHALVVPIEEIDHWVDMPDSLNEHIFRISRRISRAIRAGFPCDRVGLIIAGYEVNHCHVHLIPTQSMADLDFTRAALHVARDELDRNSRIIAEAMDSAL